MEQQQQSVSPSAAAPPAAAPAKLPMKMPMKMPMPGFAHKIAVPAPGSVAAPMDLAGIKRAAPGSTPVASPPRKLRRSPLPSSSSTADSDSDDSSGSGSSSSRTDSSSSSSSPGSSSSSSSSVSTGFDEEPTFFDVAKESGMVDTRVLEEEEEPAAVEGPPPRPPVLRSLPSDIDKALKRYKERLNREENLIQIKDDNKSVSLGTSKINYIDPRIVCSWARAQNVPISKIFSATILKKFPWAMDAEDYDF